MPFSQLPPEIVQQVIVAAVQVRGVKRASRLRYVCRSWAHIVLHAIFVSGLLEDGLLIRSRKQSFFRSRYLAYEVLGTRRSRALCIVRKVAERLVSLQCGRDHHGDVSSARLQQCVFDVCDMPHIAMDIECSGDRLDWLATGQLESIDEDDMQFQQALITAAVWLNENSVVEEVLPRFRDHLYLVAENGYGGVHRFELIFGSTISMAAWRGNHEAIQSIMMAVSPRDRASLYHGDILIAGTGGDQLSTINLVLGMRGPLCAASAAKALEHARSPVVFDKLLPLAKNHLENDRRKGFATLWAPMQLDKAAKTGNLDIAQYLLTTLEITPSAFWFTRASNAGDPVYSAARHGHRDVVLYLVGRGFKLNQKSLCAAVAHGNLDHVQAVTQVALQAGGQEYSFPQLLLRATTRENEAVVRYLLSKKELRLNDEDKTQALRKAEDGGLQSMARLLRAAMRSEL